MKTKRNSLAAAGKGISFLISSLVLVFILMASCRSKESPLPAGLSDTKDLMSKPSAGSDSVYNEVDIMPVFPGGDAGLIKWIAGNTKYPEKAKENKITGRVIVQFVVGKDGSVSGAEIVEGVDPLLDAEALRVVSSLPAFEKPGMKDGEAVAVKFMIPISFALN